MNTNAMADANIRLSEHNIEIRPAAPEEHGMFVVVAKATQQKPVECLGHFDTLDDAIDEAENWAATAVDPSRHDEYLKRLRAQRSSLP